MSFDDDLIMHSDDKTKESFLSTVSPILFKMSLKYEWMKRVRL